MTERATGAIVPAYHAIGREISAERARQDERWGKPADRNHPDGTHMRWSDARDTAQRVTEEHTQEGNVAWLDILLEEVYEAAAEVDQAKLRVELIQVAAVAAAWVEAIDGRAAE